MGKMMRETLGGRAQRGESVKSERLSKEERPCLNNIYVRLEEAYAEKIILVMYAPMFAQGTHATSHYVVALFARKAYVAIYQTRIAVSVNDSNNYR